MEPGVKIAYFSMEVALESEMPTYSGGLGVLAGDTIRAAADLQVPLVAVTLLYRKGYFHQKLDVTGRQHEEPVAWDVERFLSEAPQRALVTLEGRNVCLRAWKYEARGMDGYSIPVYFLDTDLAENSDWDRSLTGILYGGDERYRLCQEVVLGMGGVRMLRALGYENIARFHMNEGHASLLTLELLNEAKTKGKRVSITADDIREVREKCVFTTHTPVQAAHDQFPLSLVSRVIGEPELLLDLRNLACCGDVFHLTFFALHLSHYVNGVAKRHGELSRLMFAGYNVDAITNGVHAATWTAEPFQQLYDRYIPGWRQDNFSLRYAANISKQEIWDAHVKAKNQLIEHVNQKTGIGMNPNVLTLGFARRATAYKRADLLFEDLLRLKKIDSQAGPLQVIYAGKAHPRDDGGKEIIRRIFEAKDSIKNVLKVTYLENYDLRQGNLVTAGVDVWLNTPEPPLEASGTSGMKAALNGVPSLSVLDGWWIEGHIEGVTGWSIGDGALTPQKRADRKSDAASLYDKLETIIIPLFYRNRNSFIDIMRHTIALNGSFFNTHRMLQQYVLKAYF